MWSRLSRFSSYAQDVKLPKYPVPDLLKTLERYTRSVKPFLCVKDRCKTDAVVGDFGKPGGQGEILQQMLLDRAEDMDNWLAEWWLDTKYLKNRKSVVIQSSPAMVFPPRSFENENEQLEAAAGLVAGALDFKNMIDKNLLPLEEKCENPLDMSQYSKIFGSYRAPKETKDCLLFNDDSDYIIVMYMNRLYKVIVKKNDENYLNRAEIQRNLEAIMCQKVEKRGIGLLTSQCRNTWAIDYCNLCKDSCNKEYLKQIQNSLFIVCIDSRLVFSKKWEGQNLLTNNAAVVLHGGGSTGSTGNRWFDKTIQLIVGCNGGLGINFEHSPADEGVFKAMMEHIVEYMSEKDKEEESTENLDDFEPIEELCFNIDSCLSQSIDNASSCIDTMMEDLDITCFQFQDFGEDYLVQLNTNPNSFIQMAIQYTFYRLHNFAGAQQETVSTRMFAQGRTEIVRSCTIEAFNFAEAILNCDLENKYKTNALRNAMAAHAELVGMAENGQGIDQHLFGLQLLAEEHCSETPKIFKDLGFQRSSHAHLSTSNVSTKSPGFMVKAPLVPDGYSCCYNIQSSDILFAITAWHSSDIKVEQFADALKSAIIQMKNLLEEEKN